MIELIVALLVNGSVVRDIDDSKISSKEFFAELMIENGYKCLLNNEQFFTLSMVSPPKRFKSWEKMTSPDGQLSWLPEKTKKEIRTMAIETGFFISPEEVDKYNQYLAELKSWIFIVNDHLSHKNYVMELDIPPVFHDAIRLGYSDIGWLVKIEPKPAFNKFQTTYVLTFSN